MASDDKSSPAVSWQFLLLLAASLGLLLGHKLDPVLPSTSNVAAAGDARVNAFLWEDPLNTWIRASEKAAASIPEVRLKVASGKLVPPDLPAAQLAAIASKNICLLPVVIRGDLRSAEAREMRIRTRIAVVSALGVDGFVPDDANHISLVDFGQCTLAQRPNGDPIPTEWYVPSNLSRAEPSPFSAVLVLWIRDDVLYGHPLGTVADLAERVKGRLAEIMSSVPAAPCRPGPEVSIRVIGPYWSGILVDMLRETIAPKHPENPGAGVVFFSATATMADGLLDLLAFPDGRAPTDEPTKSISVRGRARLKNSKTGPVLVNLTSTDEDIAEALLGELALRGLRFADPDTRIAIISSWDSDYSRVLPLTFAAKLRQWLEAGPASDINLNRHHFDSLPACEFAKTEFDDATTWPGTVLRAYYLSGLDGSLTSRSSKDNPSGVNTRAKGDEPQSLIRAEGEHQVDYIARLGTVFATRLHERDLPGARPGTLKAIGVFGSDVYDKLLLLQALRQKFPDAILFTDTLDARLLDAGAIDYTRNLVVVTPYGFELNPNIQVGVTPFRSSEQTATFLAVQLAASSTASSFPALTNQVIQPQRFEVGRTYPVPLKIPGAGFVSQGRPSRGLERFAGPLHPPMIDAGPRHLDFWRGHMSALIETMLGSVCLVAAMVFVYFGRFRFEGFPQVLRFSLWLVAAVAVLVIGVMVINDEMEPWTWIEGTSLWPTELIRLAAIVVTIVGFFWANRHIKRSQEGIISEFGLAVEPRSRPTDANYKQALSQVVHQEEIQTNRFFVKKNVKAECGELISVQEVWLGHLEQTTARRRNMRTLVMAALLVFGAGFLGWVFGFPAVPYRGWTSKWVDLMVMWTAVLGLTALMCWVVDETHVCLRLVEILGRKEATDWPDPAYDQIKDFRDNTKSRLAASAFLEVRFIGRVTAQVVPLIMLPFAVLTLVIAARWSYFANWHASELLIGIFCAYASICVITALRLRKAAVDAKAGAIQNVGLAIANFRAKGEEKIADGLMVLKQSMEDNQEGAFQPWHQQPVVRAILLPFGGTGLLQVVEIALNKT
jgi:hypothetical protein